MVIVRGKPACILGLKTHLIHVKYFTYPSEGLSNLRIPTNFAYTLQMVCEMIFVYSILFDSIANVFFLFC